MTPLVSQGIAIAYMAERNEAKQISIATQACKTEFIRYTGVEADESG
ncbi:hypothetical protein [Leptolyngbya sp. FACHB-16]|nr:hypothetical protein [Leptolyngbya sp. FACHB-16]MBD2155622.1 hypothetical protein [Leptolyngbya sp. FACHB-16]